MIPSPAASIDQVLPSVAAALGLEGFADALQLPAASRYVVMVVDGLGETLLREHADVAPFLSSLPAVADVVSNVPSTTATSLTSLGTGLMPGVHGMVGYTARNPATGRRMNSLKWDDGVDPTVWQPHPTVLEQVQRAGIPAAAINESRFERSGLTLCSQRGVPFHGISSTWQRLDVVLDVIESAPRGLVYAYESRLDHTGHGKGCTSQEWRDMLATIDADLRQMSESFDDDTALLVTADHGMIDLPLENRFDLDEHPQLRDDVVLLAGEARFRHLYTRPGASCDVAARWAAALGDRAIVRTQADAEEWFGPIDPQVRGRIGDVVVAALGDFAVFSSQDFAIEMKMIGFHGSVTDAEMRIPVLVSR